MKPEIMKTKICLESLLAVESESGDCSRMVAHVKRVVAGIPGAKMTLDTFGNVMVTKGKAKSFPCVVAHLDTVHAIGGGLIPLLVRGWWVGMCAVKFEQAGIGGDDKCGVFVALRALEALDAVRVVLFVDEEVGCVGSRAFIASKEGREFLAPCRYVLQADRRGSSDWVDDISGPLASDEFHAACAPYLVKHGFKRCSGAMSDVMALRDGWRGLGANGGGLSCANMSAAYYNPHQDTERINASELENVVRMVLGICRNVVNVFPFVAPAPAPVRYSGHQVWQGGRYSAKGSARYIQSTVGAEGGYYSERTAWAGRKVSGVDALPTCPECRDTVHSLVEGWGVCSDCLRAGLDYPSSARVVACPQCEGMGVVASKSGPEWEDCERCGGGGEVAL